jgi:hypothetical protein
MIIEIIVVAAAILYMFVGKLRAEVTGKHWDFKCLKTDCYMLRHLQTMLVFFQRSPKIAVKHTQ